MISAFTEVFHTLKARHERRAAIRALESLNDHQLADIGVERGFIVAAVDGDVPQLSGRTVPAR